LDQTPQSVIAIVACLTRRHGGDLSQPLLDLWISVGGTCSEAEAEKDRVARLYEYQPETRKAAPLRRLAAPAFNRFTVRAFSYRPAARFAP
jgi:hypothetical protein